MTANRSFFKQFPLMADLKDSGSITTHHLRSVYRLDTDPCKPGICKRNCKSNPYCLNHLGETKLLDESQRTAVSIKEELDPDMQVREEDQFPGIENLGATCYANGLLQLWYHNAVFRRTLYQAKPEEDRCFHGKDIKELGPEWYKQSTIGQLQALFAQMQFTKRKFVNPSDFIDSLGLDKYEQQDANEFCRLLTALVDEKLKDQTNEFIRTIFNKLFTGQLEYQTTCGACGHKSTRSSDFMELDLQVAKHKTLDDCLTDFFKEEKLNADNQYMCNTCNKKVDAIRKINLRKVPPVVNVQLLRFVYNRETNRKQKLMNSISFPERLDFNKWRTPSNTDEKTKQSVYKLRAVLKHVGQSANSGHYISEIRDRMTGNWYQFNDKYVEYMEERAAKSEINGGDINGNSKKKRKLQSEEGSTYHSKDAYMLVYYEECNEQGIGSKADMPADYSPDWEQDIPEHLRDPLATDNSEFNAFVDSLRATLLTESTDVANKRKEIITCYENMRITDIISDRAGQEYDVISTAWLVKWIKGDHTFKDPIDNSDFICQHEALNFLKTTSVKLVRSEGAEVLYEKYGGKNRLRYPKALCMVCVRAQFDQHLFRERMAVDHAEICKLIKLQTNKVVFGDAARGLFWVGNKEFQRWKVKAFNQKFANRTGLNGSIDCASQAGEAMDTDEGDDDIMEVESVQDWTSFNFEVKCEHDNLSIRSDKRKLVPGAAWRIMISYFKDYEQFDYTTNPCQICQSNVVDATQNENMMKDIADECKKQIPDLLAERYRPIKVPSTHYYIIDYEFTDRLRKFCRKPRQYVTVPEVASSSLLCQDHNKVLIDPDHLFLKFDDDNTFFEIITEHVWGELKRILGLDGAIDLYVDSEGKYETVPEICYPCVGEEREKVRLKKFTYARKRVYVVPVKDKAELDKIIEEFSASASVNGHDDSAESQTKPDSASQDKESDSHNINRNVRCSKRNGASARNRCGNSDTKSIEVYSDWTLAKFKTSIMAEFKCMPGDQHLYLLEDSMTMCIRELRGSKRTLQQLEVPPQSTIYLRVDEAKEDSLPEIKPEAGFKGTQLLGRNMS